MRISIITTYTCKKAAGPDGIPPRLLNETVYKMSLLLTFIDLSVLTPRQIPYRADPCGNTSFVFLYFYSLVQPQHPEHKLTCFSHGSITIDKVPH